MSTENTTLLNLPKWEDCKQSIAQVGEQSTSALQRFIYHNEPEGKDEVLEFRTLLAAVIDEAAGVAIQKHYVRSNKK